MFEVRPVAPTKVMSSKPARTMYRTAGPPSAPVATAATCGPRTTSRSFSFSSMLPIIPPGGLKPSAGSVSSQRIPSGACMRAGRSRSRMAMTSRGSTSKCCWTRVFRNPMTCANRRAGCWSRNSGEIAPAGLAEELKVVQGPELDQFLLLEPCLALRRVAFDRRERRAHSGEPEPVVPHSGTASARKRPLISARSNGAVTTSTRRPRRPPRSKSVRPGSISTRRSRSLPLPASCLATDPKTRISVAPYRLGRWP